MNGYGPLDPAVSGRLCLTLLHSTWQIALAALALRVWQWRRKPSAEQSYFLHVAALFAGMAAMPLTYALLGAASDRQAKITPTTADATLADRPADSAIALPSPAAARVGPVSHDVSSPAGASAASHPFSWRRAAPWLAATYFAGVALMLLRLIAALGAANRLGARARSLTDGPLFATVQTFARRWSMRLAPALAEAERIGSPKVIGLLRPTILLPAAAVSGLTVEELQLILLHELAHVRRHDMWIVLVQRLAEAALFYHPALWGISRRISALREDCCDDIACRAHDAPEPQLRYAAALVRMVELVVPERLANVDLASLAAGGRSPSELRRRVARLLGEPVREPLRLTRGMVWAGAAIALLLAFSPALAPSQAQPNEQPAAGKPRREPKKGAEPKQEATPDAQPTKAEAKNRFSFGGKVEVLAIGTHDENPDRWWNADGKPLVSLPAPNAGCFVPQWDDEGKRLPSMHFVWKKGGNVAAPGVVWRRIVFRIRDLPDGAKVTWNTKGARASGSGEVTVGGQQAPKGYFSRYCGFPADQKTADLKVGVAAGLWKKIVDAQPFARMGVGMGNGKSLVFSGAFDDDGSTVVVVSHNYFDQDFRIVAFDKQGKLHASSNDGFTSAGDISQTRATFLKLKRDELDRFEFQTREYEYVELKGLPLDSPAAEDKSR